MVSSPCQVVFCLLLLWPTESLRIPRAEDPNPLEPVVTQQAQLITELQAQIAALEARIAKQEQEVAFNARLSSGDEHTIRGSHHIVFGHVDLNLGGGYNNHSGVFTAPVGGVYEFSVKISHVPPGKMHVHVLKQGSPIAEVGANGDDNYHDRSSANVVTHLKEGDRVWVERMPGSTATNLNTGNFQTTFMGILVRAD